MDTQDITLTLPEDTVLRLELLAVQRGTTVAGLLSAELEKLVAQEAAFGWVQHRHLGVDLGTEGQIDTSRDDLHER